MKVAVAVVCGDFRSWLGAHSEHDSIHKRVLVRFRCRNLGLAFLIALGPLQATQHFHTVSHKFGYWPGRYSFMSHAATRVCAGSTGLTMKVGIMVEIPGDTHHRAFVPPYYDSFPSP